MRTFTTSLLALTFALFFTSCSQDEELMPAQEATLEIAADLTVEEAFAAEILQEVNEHRTSLGLTALKNNSDSKVKAVEHSKYMATKGIISHDNFFKRSDYLKAKGAGRVSENVAFGYRTAEEVVAAWIKSEGHREALEGNFTHSGISVVKNEKGTAYFTQIFITK
ncbi:CAP domain-containing protein [Leeuwenhoekiella sp. W20_SRS_FM14]|uniref:CAP domain-containing protein n=1 Tax=Leeuwenhoekiella sp. W20_SRS_FM14 TaxID=3240270 RepID=UPI003F97DB3B